MEPNRQLFELLVADRPRDINLDCGVGAVASTAQFLELDIGELSSFDASAQKEVSGIAGSTRTVAVFPLTELLNKHGGGRSIDFLKVDVEGWELEVFKGLDLQQYRPIVILAEATLPRSQVASHAEWEPLLLAADYSFVYFDGVNRFYLANEHAGLKKHFDAPPNAFDEFEPFELVRAKRDAEQRLENMQELDRLIAERDAAIKQRDAIIEQRNAAIDEKDNIILQLDAAIQRIYGSVIWKMTHPAWLVRLRTGNKK